MTYPEFITNRFSGLDIHIVGSGASLVGFDYSFFDNKNVIAINHAYKMTKSDYLVFNDSHFINENGGKLEYSGHVLCPKRIQYDGSSKIEFDLVNTFYSDPLKGVYIWRSSALSAITIALQGNASRIFLWGVDCRFFSKNEIIKIVKENTVNQDVIRHIEGSERLIWTHSTDDKFNHTMNKPRDEKIFNDVVNNFGVFPKDKIFNMSYYSAITFFQKTRINEIIW